MIESNIENIVASIILAQKLNLKYIHQSIETTEYKPDKFPGLVYRINNPKTATLLFSSGKSICTGAKNIENIRRTILIITESLRNIGIDVFDSDNLGITIHNIVATAKLKGDLNLNQIAIGLGLENIEYEPEQFPGLVYRMKEPRTVMLLFSSGKIVCTGGTSIGDVKIAIENISQELQNADLFL
jgi:transcription initiation factor TFIID TATA-box-binding protein